MKTSSPVLSSRASRARFASALIVGALVASTHAAAAEPTGAPTVTTPSAADVETALQLYKEGKALRESGSLAPALEKLRAAHALVETPLTAVELGKTWIALGKLVEAREVLLSVARLPVRKNESTKAAEARTEAASLATDLRPRLATLTLVLKGPTEPAPRVSVDGVVVPTEAVLAARTINPGAHHVVVEANGRTTTADVTLADGQASSLEVAVPEAPPVATAPPVAVPPPAQPPPTQTTDTPSEKSGTNLMPLVYGGFAVGVIGIGVGTVTGLMTFAKADTLGASCTADGRCPPSSQSDLDSMSTTATIANVAFVIGAVGAAVGIVGLVLNGSSSKTTARVHVLPARIAGIF